MSQTRQWQDLILPIGIISSVLVILVPLPTTLMDLLLAANITVAVIVLLTTIYVRTPLEFSIFPSLLLATTLGRLVLNVATTRLILTRAGTHELQAAGAVVQSFGDFVAGDRVVVGLVIFVIIVVIQFLVITKGATRISEVAARFALDGMPGRQMAIDGDLNAGLIDEHEAQRRRNEITQQADFYGAMDGASKFVRGDAVAAIIITLINVAGGLVIGVFESGMSITRASEVFTKLTIGDGLVSQVPALMISLAAGLLVTRSTQSVNLPSQFIKQLFFRPQVLFVAAGFLAILVFTNLPSIPLLTIGGGCVGIAYVITTKNREEEQRDAETKAEAAQAQKPDGRIEDYLTIDPMEIEIGVGLIRLADPKRGGDLLSRITSVRQGVASDIGMILPKVRIRDNMQLGKNSYRIKIANNPVAKGDVLPNMLLAMSHSATSTSIPGRATREPAFDQPAIWIEPQVRQQAEKSGYTTAEPAAVLATHLQEVVQRNADEILNRDATRHLIDELRKSSPAVVEELIPNQMKLAEVQKVLQMLLREEVPIRQLGLILETLGDSAGLTNDPVLLTEHVRQRLARSLCTRYRDKENCLHVVTLDPVIEDRIAAGTEHTERGLSLRLSPLVTEKICSLISDEAEILTKSGHRPIVLVSPQIRPALKRLTLAQLPRLIVLSYNEITRDTKVESLGVVTDAANV